MFTNGGPFSLILRDFFVEKPSSMGFIWTKMWASRGNIGYSVEIGKSNPQILMLTNIKSIILLGLVGFSQFHQPSPSGSGGSGSGCPPHELLYVLLRSFWEVEMQDQEI